MNARVAAERAAGDGDGLAARAAALLNFAIERAIFDIDNSCCVSCSISANNTGKCTVLNVDRTAGVVNIGSIRSGIGAALYSGGAAILNSHRTIQVRAISSSDIRNFDLAIFQCCIASNLHAAAVFCGQLHVGERCGLGFKSSAQECIDTSDVIGAAGDNDLTTAGSLHNALVRLGADIVQDQLALTAHRKQCSVVVAVACAGASGVRSAVNRHCRAGRTFAKVNKSPDFRLPFGIMRVSHLHAASCGHAVDGQVYIFSSDPNRTVFLILRFTSIRCRRSSQYMTVQIKRHALRDFNRLCNGHILQQRDGRVFVSGGDSVGRVVYSFDPIIATVSSFGFTQ